MRLALSNFGHTADMTIGSKHDSAKALQPLPGLTGGRDRTAGSDAALSLGSADPVADELIVVGTRQIRPRSGLRLVHIFTAVIAVALTAIVADRWLRVSTARSTPEPPTLDAVRLFATPTVLNVRVTAASQRAPWITTDAELRSSTEMWKRMHLADWNLVPATLRNDGLDNMLMRYRHVINNPAAWDRMTVFDWDAMPQPIRTVAYRRMVAYWSGFYDVGEAFGLEPAVMAQTLAAIVMSESWFDHRARGLNRDGTVDVGLAQASPYARQRLRELHASGRIDTSLSEADYLNPWQATRFVALWMALMLEETGGDLDSAIRAYNRGSADAGDQLGADYLNAVQRRLTRFIRNNNAPPSWDFVWRRSREVIRDH